MGIQLGSAERNTSETVFFLVYSLLMFNAKALERITLTAQAEAEGTQVSPSSCYYFTGKPQRKPRTGSLLDHHGRPPGTEVPRATNTTAVTESLRPTVQPKWEAKSPVTAVRTPMREMDTKKQAQPFQYSVGGTKAKRTFQKTVRKCIM